MCCTHWTRALLRHPTGGNAAGAQRRALLGARFVARAAPGQTYPEQEAEVVPATGVVRFVDADVGGDKADEEREAYNEPVPQSGPKASGRRSCDAVLGPRSGNGEEVWHGNASLKLWESDSHPSASLRLGLARGAAASRLCPLERPTPILE